MFRRQIRGKPYGQTTLIMGRDLLPPDKRVALNLLVRIGPKQMCPRRVDDPHYR